MRSTHTSAILEISPEAYAEIAGKLKKAGYSHAFDGETIDMHAIALEPDRLGSIPEGTCNRLQPTPEYRAIHIDWILDTTESNKG